jgi:hypothetical protein
VVSNFLFLGVFSTTVNFTFGGVINLNGNGISSCTGAITTFSNLIYIRSQLTIGGKSNIFNSLFSLYGTLNFNTGSISGNGEIILYSGGKLICSKTSTFISNKILIIGTGKYI